MFDPNRLDRIELKRREAEVSLPDLAFLFDDDEKPVFTVRGLSAEDIYRAKESKRRNQAARDLLQGIVSENQAEKVNSILDAAGFNDDVPNEMVMVIDHIIDGCVSPKLSRDTVVRLMDHHPLSMIQLEQKIMLLTGMGSEAIVKR